MSTTSHDSLKERLTELDRRLKAKKRQLADRGEFSDVHDIVLADTRKRQAEIRQKVEAALKKGISWSLLKSEFELEFSGMFGTFLSWQERLDAEAVMKTPKV